LVLASPALGWRGQGVPHGVCLYLFRHARHTMVGPHYISGAATSGASRGRGRKPSVHKASDGERRDKPYRGFLRSTGITRKTTRPLLPLRRKCSCRLHCASILFSSPAAVVLLRGGQYWRVFPPQRQPRRGHCSWLGARRAALAWTVFLMFCYLSWIYQ